MQWEEPSKKNKLRGEINLGLAHAGVGAAITNASRWGKK